jgi:hypothetical protein
MMLNGGFTAWREMEVLPRRRQGHEPYWKGAEFQHMSVSGQVGRSVTQWVSGFVGQWVQATGRAVH